MVSAAMSTDVCPRILSTVARRVAVAAMLKQKGYDPSEIQVTDWRTYKEEQYDKLADIIRESLDMERIYQIIEKGNDASCSL